MGYMDDFGFCFGGVGRESFEGAEDSPAATAVFWDVLTGEGTTFGDLGGEVGVLVGIHSGGGRGSVAGFEGHGEAFCCAIYFQFLLEFLGDSGAWSLVSEYVRVYRCR